VIRPGFFGQDTSVASTAPAFANALLAEHDDRLPWPPATEINAVMFTMALSLLILGGGASLRGHCTFHRLIGQLFGATSLGRAGTTHAGSALAARKPTIPKRLCMQQHMVPAWPNPLVQPAGAAHQAAWRGGGGLCPAEARQRQQRDDQLLWAGAAISTAAPNMTHGQPTLVSGTGARACNIAWERTGLLVCAPACRRGGRAQTQRAGG
jgi:hypothetical protein